VKKQKENFTESYRRARGENPDISSPGLFNSRAKTTKRRSFSIANVSKG
jgi:hypothetical protein